MQKGSGFDRLASRPFPPQSQSGSTPGFPLIIHSMSARRLRRLLLCVTALFPYAARAQTPPAIVSITPNVSVLRPIDGDRVEITAAATGSEPLTYEWLNVSNGETLATTPSLVFAAYDAWAGPGSVQLRVSNATGAVTSDPIRIRPYLRTRPSILRVTDDFELTLGSPFTLSVDWEGSLPLTIEWRKDGEIVQTGGSSHFTVDAATTADGGTYTVTLTNAMGTQRRTIRVTPLPSIAPVITQQPPDVAGAIGGASVYTYLNATGSAPMTFELVRDGNVVREQPGYLDSNDLFIPSIYWDSLTLQDFGTYTVRARNAAGTAESNPFVLSRAPLVPPVFFSSGYQPVDTTLPPGRYLRWELYPGGTGPFQFQWFKDGEAIANATSGSLTFNSLTEADNGVYTLRVTGAAGVITSAPARLTVMEPTPVLPTISQNGPEEYHFTDGGYLNFNYSYSISGTAPITYAWRHDETDLADQTSPYLNLSGKVADVVGNYYLTATNAAGSRTFHVATVVEDPLVAPAISQQPPAKVTFEPGGYLALAVETTGNPTPTYQWFKDGEPLNYGTNAYYNKSGLTTADNGVYHVVATNSQGAARSDDVLVSVESAWPLSILRQPASFHVFPDRAAGQLSIQFPRSFGATYQWYRDDQPLAGQTQSYYNPSITPLIAGSYTVKITQEGQTITSEPAVITTGDAPPDSSPFIYTSGGRIVRDATDNALDQISGYGEALLTVHTLDVPLSVAWSRNGEVVPGLTDLSLWSDQWDGQEGDFTVTVTTAAGTFTSRPMKLQRFNGESLPVITVQPRSQSVGLGDFGYHGPVLSVEASSPTPMTFQWFRNGDPVPGAVEFTLLLPSVTPATLGDYFVRISTPLGAVDSEIAKLDALPLDLPVIVRQPVGFAVTNPLAGYRELSVAVTSPHPVTYQWYLNDEALTGRTESSITISGDTTAAIGTLRVAVTSAAGTVWSDPAEVTLDPTPIRPSSIIGPPSVRRAPGGSVTLQPSVFNYPGTLSFQWYRNGEAIADATNYQLLLDNLSAADAADYTVQITGASWSIVTPPATVEITSAFSPLRARHYVVGGGVFPGQPITLHTRLHQPGDLTAASYSLLLPAGWSLASLTTSDAAVAPTVGETELLEWHWTHPPAGPLDFEFTLTPPATPTGTEEIAALLESTRAYLDFQALADPDPLVLAPAPARHTADLDGNGQLELSELLRVISLYNTRNGTTRTGRYTAQTGTVDGFAADATATADTFAELRANHTADTDHDGAFSLAELLRVITLYNTRSGTTRTGAYHRAAGTIDGFAAGPSE